MSDLRGNPYVTEELEVFASGNQSKEQALVAATLALAYEQRTANLIAAYQAEVSGVGRVKGFGPAIDRHNEILDRLGL